MLEALRRLHGAVEDLRKRLAKVKTPQVGGKTVRLATQEIVDRYFRTVRPSLAVSSDATLLAAPDQSMHSLLECSHRYTTKARYRSAATAASHAIRELEKVALLANAPQVPQSGTDRQIIQTLAQIIPAAALSYEQAIVDLSAESRLSWRGPATDLRESLRETLDHLAPDEAVKGEPGYKPEPNTTGPTMRQKVRYILRKRGLSKAASETTERATQAVDDAIGQFVRSVYTRSSVSTHTPTDKAEVSRVRELVRAALCEILALEGQ